MDHTRHTLVTQEELIEAVLTGATIFGPDNENIGHVSHVHGSGVDAQIVIDVGGFLGIGSKPVLVLARELVFMRDESNAVHAVSKWTKDELKALPEHVD